MNLGRKVRHDPQSREHEWTLRGVTYRHVRHAMNAPHVDQFYLGGCVGFSGTNLLNCTKASVARQRFNKVKHNRSTLKYLDNNDGIENYHQATLVDEFHGIYPPDDTGSSALGLMKWWKRAGIISEYRWTFTFDTFLTALSIQPVLVGTNWYDDMMETGANGIVHSSMSGGVGGHEYLATEIIPDRKLIGYEQSWGEDPPGFGVEGRFWMPYDLAEELIINQQGDVAVPRLL